MAWGIAQSAKANGATSGTQSLAFSGSVTTGNILIVALRSEDSADPLPRPTDTQGNSYTLLGEAEAGIDPNTAVYGAVATATGVCTVSEAFVVGGGNWGMTLAEVSGGPGQVHFDVNGWVGASSGTSATVTATSATAVANTLAIAFFSLQRGLSGTLSVPPSGWTDINAQTTMTDGAFDLAYQVQSAAGSTPSATWSWTGSGSSTAIVITLRPDTQSNPKVITRAMGNTPASATTLTIPFPPTTAGTTPVIFFNPDSASVTSVIDSASNAWTQMTGSAGRLQGYYLLGSANTGGITSVTVTISPAKVVWGGTYLELSGIDATTPLRTLVLNNTFASGFTATTPGAAQSGDLVLAVGGGTAQLQSIDSSYVTMEWVGPSSNLLDAVKVASAATTQSATYGMGSADGLWYCVAVFAAAVAATAAQTAVYLPRSLVNRSSKWAIFRYYRPRVYYPAPHTPVSLSQPLSASLPLAGVTRQGSQRTVAGSLSFIGATSRSAARTLARAAASFSGTAQRGGAKSLQAGFSFAGTVARATVAPLAAGLSFLGSGTHAMTHLVRAAASFSGTLVKTTTRPFSAALPFIGTRTAAAGRLLAGTLSSAGSVLRATGYGLSGALLASGAITRQAARRVTASLPFLGVPTRAMGRLLAASSPLSGLLSRSAARPLAGVLSIAGDCRHTAVRMLTTASLAFLGAVSAIKNGGAQAFTQALSASLSLAGTVQRATARTLPQAALSFIGQSQSVLTRLFSASLASAGEVTRQVGKTTAAVLQGSATLSRSASRLFPAMLSATGALTTPRLFQQLLTASLALTGAIGARAIGRTLAATLPLTGQAHRAASRALAAAVLLAGATGRAVARLTLASLALSAALARGTARSLGAQLGWVGRLLGPPVNTWPGRITLTLLRLARVTPTAATTSRVTISAALRARVTIAAEE